MSTSKFEIIQRAASRTGNGSLSTLDDDTDVAEIVKQHYDGIVEQMLTQHAWKFARRVAQLAQLNLVPELPWNALYQTPPDCLSLQYVQTAGAERIDHEERDTSMGRAIAVLLSGCSPGQYAAGWSVPTMAVNVVPGEVAPVLVTTPMSPALLAVYTARVAEDRFPGDFALALQYRMEAIFYAGISEDQTAAAGRDQMAERVEQKARVRDQRASTPTDPNEWDLTRARRRGSAWGAFRDRGRGYV